jgi:hypothetical protein
VKTCLARLVASLWANDCLMESQLAQLLFVVPTTFDDAFLGDLLRVVCLECRTAANRIHMGQPGK